MRYIGNHNLAKRPCRVLSHNLGIVRLCFDT